MNIKTITNQGFDSILIADMLKRIENANSYPFEKPDSDLIYFLEKEVIKCRLDFSEKLHNSKNHGFFKIFNRSSCKSHKINLFRITNWFSSHPKNEFEIKSKLKSSFYIPPKINSTLQRANLEGDQVLYLADSPNVAIEEMNLEKGNVFFLSVWQFNTLDLCFSNYSYSYKSHGKIAKSYNAYQKAKDTLINNYNENTVDCMSALNNFYSEAFLTSKDKNHLNDKYYISSSLAHRDMYADGKAGVIYPTVRKEITGTNFAIRKEIADKKVKLKKVYLAKFNERKSSTSLNFQIVAVGKPRFKKVKWSGYDRDKHQLTAEELFGMAYTRNGI